MKPGRELDALIAEKVMGLKLKREDCNSYWIDSDGEEPAYPTEFSTDIAAAWEVVEKVNLFVFPLRGLWVSGSSDDEQYFCDFGDIATIDGSYYNAARATTAPHAICLAALKSVGVNADKSA